MTLYATGYGAGRARLHSAPNLLRAVVGELEGHEGDVELLEANIDDAPGELLGAAVERLARLLMRETGTLGVRHHAVGRTVAGRRHATVALPYGKCRVKVGTIDGEDFIVAPEYADAAILAEKTGLPLLKVYEDAKAAFGKAAEGGRGQHFS